MHGGIDTAPNRFPYAVADRRTLRLHRMLFSDYYYYDFVCVCFFVFAQRQDALEPEGEICEQLFVRIRKPALKNTAVCQSENYSIVLSSAFPVVASVRWWEGRGLRQVIMSSPQSV